MENGQGLHRRKSSKDEDENVVPFESPLSDSEYNDSTPIYGTQVEPAHRSRTLSSPHTSHTRSISFVGGVPPSPFRTGFNLPRSPNGVNGHLNSPLRPTFNTQVGQGHSRTRSTSTPFSPTLPSPLSGSFSMNGGHGRTTSSLAPAPTMYAFPSTMALSQSAPESSQDASMPVPTTNPRRHSRLHSRNLSIFFPRPGSLPHTVISEDGGQEIEVPVDEEAPSVEIPAAGSSVQFPKTRDVLTPLGQGFTFGGRPPSTGPIPPSMTDSGESSSHHSSTSASSRRGHHHKHSMSHNFFSFLEPVQRPAPDQEPQELLTEPTPIPVSPWVPMSGIASTATEDKKFMPQNGHTNHDHDHDRRQQSHQHHSYDNGESNIPVGAAVAGTGQFILGAWLWVQGQQIGSLSVTGLGYWVVFDAFGVGLSEIAPKWLALEKGLSFNKREKAVLRRPYGNSRVETLLLFAQAVYLMFSSVYVCKETVEHLLLSAGGGEGHHHHPGDEVEGLPVNFPILTIFLTLITIVGTALIYNNHFTLVNVTGNRIPTFSSIVRSLSSSSRLSRQESPPTTPLANMISNPYIASPLFFCIAILSLALIAPSDRHRTLDLFLAFIIAAVTFKVAYRASVVVGTVLLQTSPPRGLPSGKTEAFLRVMREVERHPQVLHLPAPHIWQLTPTPAGSPAHSASGESLVVTLQVHVRPDLGDDDILSLTKWTWEKCVAALSPLGKVEKGSGSGSGHGRPDVTVGIVRG